MTGRELLMHLSCESLSAKGGMEKRHENMPEWRSPLDTRRVNMQTPGKEIRLAVGRKIGERHGSRVGVNAGTLVSFSKCTVESFLNFQRTCFFEERLRVFQLRRSNCAMVTGPMQFAPRTYPWVDARSCRSGTPRVYPRTRSFESCCSSQDAIHS